MLFPSSQFEELRQKLSQDLNSGRLTPEDAAARLSELGDESLLCLIRGNQRTNAGDRDGAEQWFWKGLALLPAQFTFYLSLSEIMRARNGRDDPVAQRLLELALWKLAYLETVPSGIAAHFRESIGAGKLDYEDPESYQMLATVQELERQKKYRDEEDAPEVRERLLPYLLLDQLQRGADGVVPWGTLEGIRKHGPECAPLLLASLRDWARSSMFLQPRAVALFAAVLGEIGGADLLPDLMELALYESEGEIFWHVHWAIMRLGQRFPGEVLAAFDGMARNARPALRCAIADHLALMPKEANVGPVIQNLLDGFQSFAKDEDAPYLLTTVGFVLQMRDDPSLPDLFTRYGDMLPRKARKWILKKMEEEDGFIPILLECGLDELDIQAVCLKRELMDEEDDDEESEDEAEEDDEEPEEYEDDDVDEDFDPILPVAAPLRPGRNDPCWCGSGKKYKKCHLAADEEADRSAKSAPARDRKPAGKPGPVPVPAADENDNQMHKRLGNRVLSAVKNWYSEAELKEASNRYFGAVSKPEIDDDRLDRFFQWLLHDYRPRTGRTAFEEYLRREGHRLPSRERAMLESMRDAVFGLYEVQRVEEGRGIEVRNVFRGDRFFVDDVSASKELVKWDCVLCRIENFEGRYVPAGNGQLVPRLYFDQFMDFVERQSPKAGKDPAPFVEANSHFFHRKLDDWVHDYAERFTLTNSLGERIEFAEATYEIRGELPAVRKALSEIEVFREVTTLDASAGQYRFDWVDRRADEPAISYGSIEVSNGRLRLSCQSRQRLKEGRRILEEKLGRLLGGYQEKFESLEDARRRRQGEGLAKPKTPVDPAVERELALKWKSGHYARWPDESLPALDGQTPRQAVLTEAGRAKVRDLVRGIENLEEHERKQGKPALDLAPLRQTLGLTED